MPSRKVWKAYGVIYLIRAALRGPAYLLRFLARRQARREIGRRLR